MIAGSYSYTNSAKIWNLKLKFYEIETNLRLRNLKTYDD